MKNAAKLLINNLPKLKVALAILTSDEVLVGVPAEAPDRKPKAGEPSTPLNNATIAYLMDKGSPANNVPARPFMEPGIQDCKDKVVKVYKVAAKGALGQEGAEGINKAFHTSGLIAQAAIRNKINSGIAPALSERTLAARRKRGRTGTVPLVDTGQLRNSISYVIRRKTLNFKSYYNT